MANTEEKLLPLRNFSLNMETGIQGILQNNKYLEVQINLLEANDD